MKMKVAAKKRNHANIKGKGKLTEDGLIRNENTKKEVEKTRTCCCSQD